jgi:plastocyanin
MRRTLIPLLVTATLLGALALSACGGYGGQPAQAPAKRTTTAAPKVEIANFAFAPQHLKVKTGQTITWTNTDSAPHTVTATKGADFDSGTLQQGDTFTWKAEKAGTIEYFCAVHPSMVATITVE